MNYSFLKYFLLLLTILISYSCSNFETPIEPIIPNEEQGNVFDQNKLLGKGINLGNALEAPNEGEWGVVLKEEFFSIIKNAGFNSVRIPIKWSAHAITNEPYTIQSSFFERVDWAIYQALKNNLAVVINIHHYDEIMQNPQAHKARFLKIWEQIALRYKDYSHKLFFEILNEPHSNLTPSLWNVFMIEAIEKIRISNPTRTILVGTANWGGVSSLSQLVFPPNESNIILSFHYYSPFQFTHQGAEWVSGSDAWLGLTWSGNQSEKNLIINDFNAVASWAASKNIPVNLGEFGAYSKADMNSRVWWTSFIVELCNQYKFSFHYWEFCAGFGIYDLATGKFRESLYRALIPQNL
ncbi:MAG: glycoside hydrolase family 5 protein [Ignavibacteria bacterium]|nr:glycoside hydrolase family 5 protein [Ignavibacteria bacterium]